MEYSTPPCDLDEVRRYRLRRVREALIERDLAGINLYDQLNTRYAVDATNMQMVGETLGGLLSAVALGRVGGCV